MKIKVERSDSSLSFSDENTPRESALGKWLAWDIQSDDEAVEQSLDFISRAESGESNYWGGNRYYCDFTPEKVILKDMRTRDEYEFSLTEMKSCLKSWKEAYKSKFQGDYLF